MDTMISTVTALLEQWIVAAMYAAVALLLNAGVAILLRTKRQAAAAEAKPIWHHRAYIALGKPLYILIWAYGAYLAFTPVLLKLKPEQGLTTLRHAMDLLFDLGTVVALFWFLLRATHVLEAHLAAWASTTPSKIDDLLVPLFGTALRVIVVVVAIILGLPMLGLSAQYASLFSKLTSIVLIAAVALLLFRGVTISQNVVLSRFDITAADNLRARQVYTQLHVISRVVYVAIGVVCSPGSRSRSHSRCAKMTSWS
jgi:hypothetical protein